MDLSIVIVNWNTHDYLRACLASLGAVRLGCRVSGVGCRGDGNANGESAGSVPSRLPTPDTRHPTPFPNSEIIVVDNASADGSAEMVRTEFPDVVLIANTENRGYAAGNNQGLAVATGAFLLLLNPDTEVPAGAVEAMIAFLDEHPQAGAAAPRLVHPDGRTQESVRGFPTPAALWGAFSGLGRDAYRVPIATAESPMPVDQPMASCFLMRREAFSQVGPMDEDFPIFFNDVDLCYRLRQAGWEIWYLPGLHVLHHGGAATRQVRPEMIRESHRSLRRFYAKHYRHRLPAPLYAVTLGAIAVSGALRYLLAVARR